MGHIEQHLRAELASNDGALDAGELEGIAFGAYASAGLSHLLEDELPPPAALALRLGLRVRAGDPPGGSPVVLVGSTIVHRAGLRRRELGLGVLHETSHALFARSGARHTHADVVALTLVLALPHAALRSARLAGELEPAALLERQRYAPRWALVARVEQAIESLGIEAA